MKFKTVEEMEKVIDDYYEIVNAAIPLLDFLAELDGRDSRSGFDHEDVTVYDHGTIEATWDNYRCGESDYRTVRIEIEDLLNPDFQTELKARHDAELKRKREQAVKAQRERERAAYRARFEQYEKLKAEFEDDPAAPRTD
jgi:hypothetical protein